MVSDMGLFSNFNKKKRDGFAAREKQQQVWKRIRRLVDLSTPSLLHEQESQRNLTRYNRCVPIGCVPMNTEGLDTSSIFYGSTKDFSDNGVSFISPQLVECTEIICGFWLDDVLLLEGLVRRVQPFGGNLYEVGIEFTEVIDSTDIICLLRNELQILVPTPA